MFAPRFLLRRAVMRVASLVPLCALIGGVAVGVAGSEHASLPAVALAVLWLGSAVALGGVRRAWSEVLVVGVALVFGGGGALLGIDAAREAWRPSLRHVFEGVATSNGVEGVQAVVTGVLRTDAATGDEVVTLQVDVSAITILARGTVRASEWIDDRYVRGVRGGVRLSVAGDLAREAALEWRAGRTVTLPAWLRRPTTYRNPGALDEERSLARRGISLVGSVKSGALVEVAARGPVWAEAAAEARAAVRRVVRAHVGLWDPTSAAIVTAILIGDRAGLRPDVQERLQDAGTYHVLAISGGNVAVLAVITLALFRWTGTLGRAAMIVAITSFLVYGYVVEGGASVDRAVTVAVLAFAARAIDHRLDATRGLSIAAGLLVAGDPLALFDPGFLLSFGATLGIVVTMPLLRRSKNAVGLRTVIAMFVASLAAELALLPVVAFFFGRVTVAGLVLNFAAIPLMTVAQIAGLLLVPAAALSSAMANAVGWVAAMAGTALVGSASAVEWMPSVAWRVARPSLAAMAAYCVALSIALAVWRLPLPVPRRWAWRYCASAAACGAALWLAAEPWTLWTARGDGRLHVTFLDVGQGDATLVRFPRGATMLVDAGGTPSEAFDIGGRVVVPALRYLGVRRLDSLVLTHGDSDHVGGAASVARAHRPFDVWEGVPVPGSSLLGAVRHASETAGARWTTMQRADQTEIDGVRVLVHHPVPPDWERQEPRNDDSIVLELRWGDVSLVLPGDIGRGVEETIGERFEPAALRVLKAAHHGSASSSSEPWLARLRPVVAIVSAGRHNPFGHPAPSVLTRYESIGSLVYRTDRDGAISIDTDGSELVVRTGNGRSDIVRREGIPAKARGYESLKREH